MSLNIDKLKRDWMEKNLVEEVSCQTGVRIEFKRESTKNLIWKTVKANHHLGLDYNDIMELALEQAVQAVLTFKFRDFGAGWDDILQGNVEQINKLWKAINVRLGYKLSNVDPLAKRSYDNATKSDLIIKPNIVSLNQESWELEGSQFNLAESLTEKNRLVAEKEDDRPSELLNWLENQGINLLSVKQQEYVQNYLKGNFGDRNGYLPRIRARLQKEIHRQNMKIYHTEWEWELHKRIEILKQLQKLIDLEEYLEQQNYQITSWVKEFFHLEWIDDLIYQELGIKDYQKIVKLLNREKNLSSILVYKLSDVAITKLDEFQLELEKRQVEKVKCEEVSRKVISLNITESQPSLPYKTKVRTLLPTGFEVEKDN